jgi:autotransporter-associated beta strand protein
MKKTLTVALCLTFSAAFAGWNGAGVPGGTGGTNINDLANWTGGNIDGDFSAITLPGPTALALTNAITFANGATYTKTATFASNATEIVLSSTNGLAVGQVVSGTGIRYNSVLVGLNDITGIVSQATTAISAGNYTFIRPALNFDFGVLTARSTNVIVTLGSEPAGAARTITISGRVLQTQNTPAASSNAVTFSSDLAFALTAQTIVSRETGSFNGGTLQPRLTINGPVNLGAGGGVQRLLYAGGELTLNGVVSGAGSGMDFGGADTAGKLTLTNPDNSFSGGTYTGGWGTPLANSSRALANTGTNSALGSAGSITLNNIKLSLQGFTSPQISDRTWNVGNDNAAVDNNGPVPVILTGPITNNVWPGTFRLGGTYQNYGTPNVVSGSISSGTYTLAALVSRGVWLLNNDANPFTGSVSVGGANRATLQFTSVADIGVASALGAGKTIEFQGAGGANNINYIEYVGTNNVAGNRVLRLSGNVDANGENALFANGLGALNLSGVVSNALTLTVSGVRTRNLYLGGLGTGVLSGSGVLDDLISGSYTGRVAIIKSGPGTWTLSGNNLYYQGATDIKAGNLILDYTSYDQVPAASPNPLRPDGGMLTFKGKPVGTTSDTIPQLQIGSGGSQYRSSTIVLDANGGDGFNLTVSKLEGDGAAQKFDLIDLSSSSNHTVTVNALGTNLKAVNGVLMNNASAASSARALLVLHTATNYGFAALSGVTSGTLQPLSGQTPLPSSGYSSAVNYLLKTASTVTSTTDLAFSTLTLDTSAGSSAVALGAKLINNLSSGRAILAYGPNDATISGTGTASHVGSGLSLFFHNYLDTNATLNVNANMGTGSFILYGGPGFTTYSGQFLGNNFYLGGGVFRVTAAQTVSMPGGIFVLANGSVLEIGADLNGAAAGDFTYPLGIGNGTFSLYGNCGLSAADANRVVNFGGAGAGLTWGTNGFLTFADSTVDYGYTLKLSSARANATLEIQNPLDLNGNSHYGRRRTVEVANGSAAVDARLSGAISGNAAFVKSGEGTLELTGKQSYDGPLMVMAGALRVGADNIFTNTLTVQLRGGGLSAGSGTNAFGRLELFANATLDTGDGTAALAFANSSASAWSGTLKISGALLPTTLRFGTNASGLTAAQLASIKNGNDKVGITASGYLYRIPAGTAILVW